MKYDVPYLFPALCFSAGIWISAGVCLKVNVSMSRSKRSSSCSETRVSNLIPENAINAADVFILGERRDNSSLTCCGSGILSFFKVGVVFTP